MRILITGGSGFIGTHLTGILLEKSTEIALFDIYHGDVALSAANRHVQLIKGDLLDLTTISKAITDFRPTIVVHLAAFRNTESQQKPHEAFLLNCQGTVNVLSAAISAEVQRVVYASTVAVYGSPENYRKMGFDPFCLTEEAPPNPSNVYGVTKLLAEGMARQYTDIYGLETIGLRLPIILGPGKKMGSKTSGFNDVIEKPLMGQPVQIDSYADQVLNLMYAKDAAYALERACFAPEVQRRVYNTGGVLCRTRDLVGAVISTLPQSKVVLRETDQERKVASGIDSSVAEREIGYRPNFSLEAIVEDYQRELIGT